MANRSEYTEAVQMSFGQLEPGVRMVIENANGSVVVEGWNEQGAQVQAIKRVWAHTEEEGRRLLDRLELKADSSPDYLGLEVGGRTEQSRLDLTVRVPRQVAVTVDTASGEALVRGILGPVHIDSSSGPVTVTNCRGDVVIDTGSGSVHLEDTEGGAHIDTGSGSVTLKRVSGEAYVDTGSGSVEAQDVAARLTLDTASGGVRAARVSGDLFIDGGSGGVTLDDCTASYIRVDLGSGSVRGHIEILPDGKYSFDTGSGEVVLTIPAEAETEMELESSSGSIDCRLPLQVISRERRKLVGILNSPGALLKIETGSGPITLKAAGSDQPRVSPGLAAEKRKILELVGSGKLSADDAAELLKALERRASSNSLTGR